MIHQNDFPTSAAFPSRDNLLDAILWFPMFMVPIWSNKNLMRLVAGMGLGGNKPQKTIVTQNH